MMEVEIVSQDKNLIEVKIDNQTVAEVLRAYLNNQGVKFAAWRKEHPTRPLVFRIQTDKETVKKAVSEAVSAINKDCENIIKALKK